MHQAVTQRLADAGLELPSAPGSVGDYVPAVLAGNLVFTSGQIPMVGGSLPSAGVVGDSVSVEDARYAAGVCALRALAAAAAAIDLDRVVRVVKVTGYVASSADFTAQPTVIDGASAVMRAAFGEAGAHAREAVGVVALPLGAPVEVSVVLEIA